MAVILVNELIETGFSLDDAKELFECIEEKIKIQIDSNEKIVIDFDKVKFFTTQFFNNSISKYVLAIGQEEFNKKFSVINLSDVGLSTYQHSYDNAVSYYNLPVEKRLEQNQTVDENEEQE